MTLDYRTTVLPDLAGLDVLYQDMDRSRQGRSKDRRVGFQPWVAWSPLQRTASLPSLP
jgi:hypothetical protein